MSTQITVRLPDEQTAALDAAATALKRSRAEVVRQAIERYLEDFDDLSMAVERLRDPSDPVLDWGSNCSLEPAIPQGKRKVGFRAVWRPGSRASV